MAKERNESKPKYANTKTGKLRRETKKKKNVDRRDGMKKENNLINCKKGMIMAKRVWAHKMATCGAKRDTERCKEETVG